MLAWCYSCNRGGDVLDITAMEHVSPAERRRLDREARERRERQHARTAAHKASLEAEKGLPRPRKPEDLAAFDRVYAVKDRLDAGIEWACDGGTLAPYLQGLRAWRRWAEPRLKKVG